MPMMGGPVMSPPQRANPLYSTGPASLNSANVAMASNLYGPSAPAPVQSQEQAMMSQLMEEINRLKTELKS